MKGLKTKNNFLTLSSIFVISILSVFVYAQPVPPAAGSEFSMQATFTASETSSQASLPTSFAKSGKYNPDQAVIVRIKGSVVGTGDLQYLGLALVKLGTQDIIKRFWINSDGTAVETSAIKSNIVLDRCSAAKTCTKDIKLPGKASDYRGMEVLPVASGSLDGKRTERAVFGGYYIVPVAGISLDLNNTIPNVKPEVKISVSESQVFRGASVKITAEATAPDRDLMSVRVNIPSMLSRSQEKSCSYKEKSSCKLEFTIPLTSTGDITFEAVAHDLRDTDSDKATATVKVLDRISVAQGALNTFVVNSDDNFKKWIQDTQAASSGSKAYMIDMPGVLQCGSGSKFAALGSDFVWKNDLDLLYEITQSDKAIVIYCMAPQTGDYAGRCDFY